MRRQGRDLWHASGPLGRMAGRGPELAERVLDQINEQRQSFDVVVVDGPCGCNDLCLGRMVTFAAAVELAAPDLVVFAS